MHIYIPTYLYIKQHTITGKLYFGKTQLNPEKYFGSGKHWKAHIKKHGKEHVINMWYFLFVDKNELMEFAAEFSTKMDIVKSGLWLNLIPENGLDGASKGSVLSKEHRASISRTKLGKPIPSIAGENHYMFGKHLSEERKLQNSIASSGENNPMFGKVGAMTGKKHSKESIDKIIAANTGSTRSEETKKNMSNVSKQQYANGRVANGARSVCIDGIFYESIKKASDATGISKDRIRKMIN